MDRDAQDIGRMRAIAKAMLQGVDNQIAFNIRNRSTHQRTAGQCRLVLARYGLTVSDVGEVGSGASV